MLISGAETVDDSGVGDCSEILILSFQYGTVTVKVKKKLVKNNSGTVEVYDKCSRNLEDNGESNWRLGLRFSECYRPAEAGRYGNF